MSSDIEAKLKKLLDLTEALEARKALYDELDQLTLELQAQGFDHAVFEGKDITLVDNFNVKNVVFRPAGVRRYECKIKDAK